MGVPTHFIKATGNCRIKKSLIKELIEKQSSSKTYYFYSWIFNDLQLLLEVDDEDEECISLEKIGEMYDDTYLYDHLDDRKVWDLYLLYEMMSLNGMECFKSVTSPHEPEVKQLSTIWYYRGLPDCRDYGETNFESVRLQWDDPLNRKVVEGILRSHVEFKSFDELYRYIGMPINQPIMNISIIKTERFCDLKIVTKSDELIKQDNKKKCKKYNTEPCRLYFCDEDDHYFYFEFLPYGKGVKMGTCIYYPYVIENCESVYTIDKDSDDSYTFFQNVRNEYLTWSVEDLY